MANEKPVVNVVPVATKTVVNPPVHTAPIGKTDFQNPARRELNERVAAANPPLFEVVKNPGNKNRESLRLDDSVGSLETERVADKTGRLTLDDIRKR